ncbi:MAG: hypothetical protein Ct9H90mP2_03620 [Dehalococcoidia bacterium]|nr:MAG: hypothetical protein Ct9H90mP2_03620 [Dehalococcoidia bacterium]
MRLGSCKKTNNEMKKRVSFFGEKPEDQINFDEVNLIQKIRTRNYIEGNCQKINPTEDRYFNASVNLSAAGMVLV